MLGIVGTAWLLGVSVMVLAHGDIALDFWLAVLLLVFVVPFVFFVLYRKKPYAVPVAFTWVCVAISVLLIYLMLTRPR